MVESSSSTLVTSPSEMFTFRLEMISPAETVVKTTLHKLSHNFYQIAKTVDALVEIGIQSFKKMMQEII